MDKSKYHAANEHALGVKLRRFQQWVNQEAEFKQRIKEKAKPKVEKTRKQNKVVCQGEREHFTPTDKIQLIMEFESCHSTSGNEETRSCPAWSTRWTTTKAAAN